MAVAQSASDGVAIHYVAYFRFVDDVDFSRYGAMTRHVYISAAMEHDKHSKFCSAIQTRSTRGVVYPGGKVCYLRSPC